MSDVFNRPAAVIHAIRGHLPDRVLTNDELAGDIGWSSADIERKTGISARHIAAADECASDLATRAALKLFADYSIEPKRTQFVIFCTQTPDYFLPASACLIQSRLGLPDRCAAFDLNQGCSGYIYALAVAAGFIRSGMFREGLVLTADTYTKLIHPKDRSVRTLFGDAGTATWLMAGDEPGLGEFVLGTDGSGADNLIVQAGGLRLARTPATAVAATDNSGNVRSADNLCMNGRAIFEFTLRRVPDMIAQVLAVNSIAAPAQPDWYVFHQANAFMLEHLRNRLSIPRERMVDHLKDVGNTVSSTIPLALEAYSGKGMFSPGQQLLLAGFGVGYSWGGTVLTWRVGSIRSTSTQIAEEIGP